jgi:hypothetical protein
MKDFSETVALRVAPSVRLAESKDGAVLLEVGHGVCFGINPVGTIIWKRINEGSEPKQIAQQLAETFNITVEQAYSDVQDFLESLKQKQLLEPLDNMTADSGERGGFTEALRGLWKSVCRCSTNHTE